MFITGIVATVITIIFLSCQGLSTEVVKDCNLSHDQYVVLYQRIIC